MSATTHVVEYDLGDARIVRLQHCVSLEFNPSANLVIDLNRGIYKSMTTDEIESAVWSEYVRWFDEEPNV